MEKKKNNIPNKSSNGYLKALKLSSRRTNLKIHMLMHK
jgi:hypothetical protein